MIAILEIDIEDPLNNNSNLCDEKYIKFGSSYILHPQSFVLAVTLEWVRLPMALAAYIHGKSSWGRRGLIIATASVVHPGFTGCITLEITNLGEVPIKISPGMHIAQLCLHEAQKIESTVDASGFNGQRKPFLGRVKTDELASILKSPLRLEGHL